MNAKSDMLLYNALKNELKTAKSEGRKPFYDKNGNLIEFHKPKSDGTEGPLVRKVKIMTNVQSGGELTNNAIAGRTKGAMIRIDVFKIPHPKDPDKFKYYYVPIYIDDAVKKTIPMRAATASKPKSEWKLMKDKDFVFSLYPNDLVHIKSQKGITAHTNSGNLIKPNDIYVYYKSAGISNASISAESHDEAYTVINMGIQNVDDLEKCKVDVLGNITLVKREKRKMF